VRIQSLVQFATLKFELQPDVMQLRPCDDFYTTSHPIAADVLLLIQVVDTCVRLEQSPAQEFVLDRRGTRVREFDLAELIAGWAARGSGREDDQRDGKAGARVHRCPC
jgi:hypothetical protein